MLSLHIVKKKVILLKETLNKNIVNWNILVTMRKEIKKDFVSSGERTQKKIFYIIALN